MLWKCCTQYASKSGKLSSGHRTGKGQFSFQSQRKAVPKNAQTVAQLHSSHMLVPQHSKGHIRQAYSKYSQWWKTESIPPKIRNKKRVSTFTTIIQHSSESPSYNNQRRKRNKRNPDQKRRSKALTVYIENTKDTIRKLLKLISEFSKVAGYKIKYTEIICSSIY